MTYSPPQTLLASSQSIGNFVGIGPLGNTSRPFPENYFVEVISRVIGVLTIVAGIYFIFQMFIGSVNWLSAGSDKQGVDNAKKRITNAIIGLLLVVVSYSLIAIVSAFLGIDLINLGLTITNIMP
jgi:hypothetical protein